MKVKFKSGIGIQTSHVNRVAIIMTADVPHEPTPPMTFKDWAKVVLWFIGRIILTLTGVIIIVGLGLFAGGWMAGHVTDPTSRTLLAIGIGYICAQLIGILWMVIWMR